MKKKPPIPSHVLQYLDDQRRQQRAFNSLAVIKGNLRDTTQTAIHALDQLHQRGTQLDDTEIMGEELVHTSRIFLMEMRPWWKRLLCCDCLPHWWFDSCKRPKTKVDVDEAPEFEIQFLE